MEIRLNIWLSKRRCRWVQRKGGKFGSRPFHDLMRIWAISIFAPSTSSVGGRQCGTSVTNELQRIPILPIKPIWIKKVNTSNKMWILPVNFIWVKKGEYFDPIKPIWIKKVNTSNKTYLVKKKGAGTVNRKVSQTLVTHQCDVHVMKYNKYNNRLWSHSQRDRRKSKK